jgi:hypothetical protein
MDKIAIRGGEPAVQVGPILSCSGSSDDAGGLAVGLCRSGFRPVRRHGALSVVADRFVGMDEITIRDGEPAVQVASVVSWLACVDPEGVTERARLDAVAALEALKGAAAAAQARLTAAAVGDREALGEDSRSVRAEVALARRC